MSYMGVGVLIGKDSRLHSISGDGQAGKVATVRTIVEAR